MTTTPPPLPPPLPSQPLDYSGPDRFGHTRRLPTGVRLFSAGRFIATAAIMFVLLAIFILVVPRLSTIYADFGTPLPLITRVILGIGRFMQTPAGWISGVIVAGGVSAVVAFLPVRGRWLRLVLLLLLALVVLALALAVLLPMLNLIESISNNPGKL